MVNTPNTMDWSGNEIIYSGHDICTTQNVTTSSTTVTNIVGLKHNCTYGTYYIDGWINGSAASSGGVKLILAGVSPTAINITTWNYNGTTLNAVTNVTSLPNALTSNAAAFTDLIIKGYIVVAEPSGLQFQVAQNTSNATSTDINVGSYITFTRVS